MPHDSETVARITRAFDSAFRRFAAADTFEDQEDEGSNLLHHLYRLAQAVLGSGWRDIRPEQGDISLVPALLQLRHVDTHEFVSVLQPADVIADTYTNLHGVLVWQIPRDIALQDDRFRRYAVTGLDGVVILDSLRAAKNALLAHGQSASR